MKTILFTLSTIAVLLGNKFEGNDYSNTFFSSEENSTEVSSNPTDQLVESDGNNGAFIPAVQLFSLNIVSSRKENISVAAVMNNGEIIPMVNLPELTISAE